MRRSPQRERRDSAVVNAERAERSTRSRHRKRNRQLHCPRWLPQRAAHPGLAAELEQVHDLGIAQPAVRQLRVVPVRVTNRLVEVEHRGFTAHHPKALNEVCGTHRWAGTAPFFFHQVVVPALLGQRVRVRRTLRPQSVNGPRGVVFGVVFAVGGRRPCLKRRLRRNYRTSRAR